jgi:ribosomal protein S18 acetylase RimI-like enzyme
VIIRDLREGEEGFLQEMLYAALDWNPKRELPDPEWVLAHPQAVIYHRDWGRAGDVALVAEEDGEPVGLVWWRLFTSDEHGHGFVDEATPELGIAVRDGHRGRGVGRALMLAAGERARQDGLSGLSLSVEDENVGAKRLYESLGYVDHEPGDGRGRMLLVL